MVETAHFMTTKKQKEEKQEGAGDKIKLSRGTRPMSYFLQVGLTSCFVLPLNDVVM